jgi:hypothetical protein
MKGNDDVETEHGMHDHIRYPDGRVYDIAMARYFLNAKRWIAGHQKYVEIVLSGVTGWRGTWVPNALKKFERAAA